MDGRDSSTHFQRVNPDQRGVGLAYYPKGQEKYSLFISGDYFRSFPYVNSGIALNIGLRANWNQRFAMNLEMGGNILFENHTLYGLLFPGIHSPAFNLSYRI